MMTLAFGRRVLSATVFALSALAAPIRAQNALSDSAAIVRALLARADSGASLSRSSDASAGDDREAKLAPAVTVAAAPKSFTVVRVPVPSSFSHAKAVTYQVTPAAQGTVVGRRDGIIEASPASARTLLVTLGVPSRMRAGSAALAHVRFSAENGEQIDVPIVVSVAAARQVQITPVEGLGAVRSGSTFPLNFRLTNLGNATDTIDIRVVAPTGWRLIDNPIRLRTVLGINSTVERSIRVATPAGSSGPSNVQIIALSHGLPVASTQVIVELYSDQQAMAGAGPELKLSSAAAYGPWGQSVSSAYTAQLDGQLTDDIRIFGRASSLPSRGGGSSYAFQRANVYDAPPMLALHAPTWRVGAGLTGTTFSELTGVSIAGMGVSAGIEKAGWSASALAARPSTGVDQLDGELTGARVELKSDWGTASSAMTHLQEHGLDTRSLDAFSIGGGLSNLAGGQWAAELANRRYRDGQGLGWNTTYQRHAAQDNVDIRFSHAPGGASAFARATNELSMSASRSLGSRLLVNGSAWQSSDEGSTSFRKLSTDGFSLGGRVKLSSAVGLTLTARGSDFDAQTFAGAFGNGEKGLEAGVDAQAGAFSFLGVASRSMMERSTSFDDTRSLMQHAPRAGFRGSVRSGGSNGTLALSGSYEETGPGIGIAQRHWEYGLQADRIALASGGAMRLYGNGSIQKTGGFAAGYGSLMMSAGLVLETSKGFGVTMNAERNPFLITSTGTSGWMYVLGVSHGLHLPRLSRSETRGIVFKDLNGNGERDQDEPGFAGVVVRRGFDISVTDARGNFVFVGQNAEPMSIDVRSLPLGWLLPSTTLAPGARAIGVVGVSSVEIQLTVDPLDSTRIASADLEKIALVARDSSGRAWVARRPSAGSAVFDALPPGTYSVDVDATESTEPIRLDGPAPTLRVGVGQSAAPVSILLRPRALRFTPPSRLFRRDEGQKNQTTEPAPRRAKTGAAEPKAGSSDPTPSPESKPAAPRVRQ